MGELTDNEIDRMVAEAMPGATLGEFAAAAAFLTLTRSREEADRILAKIVASRPAHARRAA